jgi:hypothetical protein
MVELEEEKNLQ